MIKTELEALFQEIGSEEKLLELMRGFYEVMSHDLLIGFFFQNKDLNEISKRQTEFLLRAMGVRSSYLGKAPSDAHRHLPPILAGHFDRRARLLEDFLKSQHLSDRSIRAWLSFEEAFRSTVQSKL